MEVCAYGFLTAYFFVNLQVTVFGELSLLFIHPSNHAFIHIRMHVCKDANTSMLYVCLSVCLSNFAYAYDAHIINLFTDGEQSLAYDLKCRLNSQ